MTSPDTVLAVRGLSAGYGPLTVLHDLDFDVRRGERVAIVGLNGHGKSTLFRAITDDDLHAVGVAALAPYRVVINGTHAEYYSERMLDATEDYLSQGCRVMYLSGNGYYWVAGWRDDEPWLMEIRKLEAGSRAWQARAGEHYLASTGEERSGLWRHRNRAPQKIVGTGFASEGMDESVAYRRMPDSWHKAWRGSSTACKAT